MSIYCAYATCDAFLKSKCFHSFTNKMNYQLGQMRPVISIACATHKITDTLQQKISLATRALRRSQSLRVRLTVRVTVKEATTTIAIH